MDYEKPKKIDVFNQLVAIASHWDMLCVALEVPDDTLQSVHQNYSAEPDVKKLSMMIEYWLNQPNATLIKAVEGRLVQQKNGANDTHKFLVQ